MYAATREFGAGAAQLYILPLPLKCDLGNHDNGEQSYRIRLSCCRPHFAQIRQVTVVKALSCPWMCCPYVSVHVAKQEEDA